jgi:hypothetical protein
MTITALLAATTETVSMWLSDILHQHWAKSHVYTHSVLCSRDLFNTIIRSSTAGKKNYSPAKRLLHCWKETFGALCLTTRPHNTPPSQWQVVEYTQCGKVTHWLVQQLSASSCLAWGPLSLWRPSHVDRDWHGQGRPWSLTHWRTHSPCLSLPTSYCI